MFLNQSAAAALDMELMRTPNGFSIDQLMELAGLAVAIAFAHVYPLSLTSTTSAKNRILAICGPGNNGGDGLVASRHLKHFGYEPTVLIPKISTSSPLFAGLLSQLEDLEVPFIKDMPSQASLINDYDYIMDAIFGFSFDSKSRIRPPFDSILHELRYDEKLPPILSIDIPSGWDVENGDVLQLGMKPDTLVSLTAPKLCAKYFTGRHHFLGGRFVPQKILAKYNLTALPKYPGSSQIVQIEKENSTCLETEATTSSSTDTGDTRPNKQQKL